MQINVQFWTIEFKINSHTSITVNSQGHFDNLKIFYVNYQSLVANYDEFLNFFMTFDYHIICMTEMWLRSKVSDTMIKLPGFSLLRWDRKSRHGDGLLLL